MTTQSDLQRLLKEVRNNPLTEPRYFEALLTATVYAHVPLKQVAGRLRFIQFVRPDNGQTVLPFFSNRIRAERASGPDVTIIAMDARQLFELTRGATLMLDPNDERAALYPEEISALLSGKPLVAFGLEKVAEPETVGVRNPTVAADDLIATLKAYCATEPDIEAGYIAEILRGQEYEEASLWVAMVATPKVFERITRTSMQRIQPLLSTLALPLLVTVITADDATTSFYSQAIRFYERL